MKRFLFLFSFCFYAFITSCEKSDNSIIENYAQYIGNSSVSTDFNFYSEEIYENSNVANTSVLILNFATTTSFPCINYGISTSSFFENNELIMRFDSIAKSDLCLTAIGPASAYIDLPESTERLVMLNGNSIDLYEINITREKVEINPVASNFTHLKYQTIFRYPENTFVYECSMDKSETTIYNDFLKILSDSLTVTAYNFSGKGRIPYAEDYTENNRKSLTKYFQYENEKEFEKAGQLLEVFVKKKSINENTTAYISLTSWKNGKYLSWMMNK